MTHHKGKNYQTLAPVCSRERWNPSATFRHVQSFSCSTSCALCQPCSPNHSSCPSTTPPVERFLARDLQQGVPLDVDSPRAQGPLLFFVAVRTRRWLKWEVCFKHGSQVLGLGCSHSGPADPLSWSLALPGPPHLCRAVPVTQNFRWCWVIIK